MDRNDNGNAVAVSDLDVALRKESVDRNGLSYFYIIKITRRSP